MIVGLPLHPGSGLGLEEGEPAPQLCSNPPGDNGTAGGQKLCSGGTSCIGGQGVLGHIRALNGLLGSVTSWRGPGCGYSMFCVGPRAGSQQGFSCTRADCGTMESNDTCYSKDLRALTGSWQEI